ncbi:ATP-binding protein [Vibrio parahaemolyticus]|nr:ATP-binding protein [Vibrio parahaemolyticus]EJB0392048.1 ATP-binding protein [Vibrio parahaemolyticus]
MKIKKVKWQNHKILGDLLLDFTDGSGSPYETIIFAGENGAGKSTVLTELSMFLNCGSIEKFDFIEYEVDNETYKAVPMPDSYHHNFFDVLTEDGQRIEIRCDQSNQRELLESNTMDLRHYGCVFSKARSDYKTERITSTTTSTLDKEKYDVDSNDDFTSLKQLIVDVVTQDSLEYMNINKSLGTQARSWAEYYPESKTYRFQNAFDSFFDKLKYDKTDDHEDEKTIFFRKNGVSIPVDELSTGEKQIVFRGIYLLKNSKVLKGSAIMVDEPELSMHPKWQQRILSYYKSLFTRNEVQEAQLFFATHSDHVISEALADNANNLVITLSENSGVIEPLKVDRPSVLPRITQSETNYFAFDLVTNDFHAELYGWLQDKHQLRTVKQCDDFIIAHPQYNPSLHQLQSGFGNTVYKSLSTYIRNAIHHPDSGNTFTQMQLRTSIELLISLCQTP